MAKLKDIDKKAEEKGKGLVTLWQFVKFIFVSLIAFVVQFLLLNTLGLIPAVKELYSVDFKWWIFTCEVAAGGLGYFIVNNTANISAQIVSFFVNREKTFNSGANVAITLPIYLVFTICLIVFSAWFNPFFKDFLVSKGLGDVPASNASTMLCCTIQFFLYFPVDKILFRKPKETLI
ncbi:MAG: hypothetical protein K6B52_05775 [Clostridiales bacterium]|nr:hypothetical protein [Clostridiales bacterium]